LRADAIRPSSRAAFDAATAKSAEKDTRAAAPLFERAMKDPALRAAALYNRGTAALNAREYDQALADLASTLRLDPANRDAKRNFELALQKKQQQKKEGDSRDKQQRSDSNKGGGTSPQPPNQQPPTQSAQQSKNDPSEALLRSVQEQENAEQGRLRRARREPREVGW
jgi:Ca-activated chloride channel family protein